MGLNRRRVTGLRALNLDEIRVRVGDDNTGNANGHFLAGVGVVRLDTFENVYFVTVAVGDCPVVLCGRCDKPLTLYRVSEQSSYNPANALFYECQEELCGGYNVYPVYPLD